MSSENTNQLPMDQSSMALAMSANYGVHGALPQQGNECRPTLQSAFAYGHWLY